ncbi:helicase-associated domain-containing protein [Streptomyces sp. NPDC015144]|uniref:helicase-associated domain-containing protein n=1 Tax=Streptomyces sp. NPDC015144 TaxID=3364944 RepID=UPI003702DFF1
MGTITPPRTLAEALRARDDASLAALLRARPDLLNPVPGDITQLATRAGTRASVVRALERLDRFALQTAEALAVAAEPVPYATLLALLTGDTPDGEPGDAEDYEPGDAPGGEPGRAAERSAGQSPGRARRQAAARAPGPGAATVATAGTIARALPRALATLREQALVWGDDDRLRLVRTARELLSPSPQHPSPTGLGPTVAEATSGMSPGRLQEILAAAGLPATHDPVSAVQALTGLFTDRAAMGALLDTAPAESLAVLDRLVWGPPYGEVTPNPAPPVTWLRDRGLLLPVSARTVVLPREAALHLRAGRAHRVPEPEPPVVTAATHRDPQAVDNAAAAQAFLAVSTVEELVKSWDGGGPPILRAGGLSVRELKRTATTLDVPERTAAFWAELAYSAGLLASDGEADERYAPTPAYDDWAALPAQERWAELATAWLAATRVPGLVGGQDAKGRTMAALGPGLDRSAAPEVRRRVLALLAGLEPGTAPAPETVLARLRWERPLRGAASAPASSVSSASSASSASDGGTADLRSRVALWTLDESELLGITGRGALAAPTRALLDDGPAEAAARLAPLLPEPLDHVLLQADLTAVAPGPLERPLAEALSVLAEIESKGGATVYRFTPGSVRRALDAGQSAADLHAFLATHSRTPVPQPLSYLIDDIARRHGHLRIGAASSYVRCDDEAVLNEILADKRSATLRLRRLAPTVLAAQADPASLLDGLREMGYAPAAESAEGDVLITRAGTRRTPPRTAPAPVPEGPPVPDATLLDAAVRAIRAGDTAATVARKDTPESPATPGALPRTTSAETLATVQAAVLTGSALWIGYVNADGAASQRVIAPVRVEGGFVTAYDHTADEIRTFPLHRITGVAELADDATA